MSRFMAVLMIIATGLLCSGLFSKSLSDRLAIHGYWSQGALKTTENNYLIKTSTNSSFEFNEAALNFSLKLDNRLWGGIQIYSRDFGPEGNNEILLDWLLIDYHYSDMLGIRFGKNKLPISLYNKSRDVDALRTCIIMPQSIYDEYMRDFSFTYQGTSAYGFMPLAMLGELEYELYYGTLSIPDPETGFWRTTFSDLSLFITESDPTISNVDIVERSVTGKYLYGSSLIWSPPVQGLRLGWSYVRGQLDLSAKINVLKNMSLGFFKPELADFYVDFPGTLNLNLIINFQNYHTFSFEYMTDRWLFTSEYRMYDYDVEIKTFGSVLYKADGYYGQTSCHVLDWLTLGAYYSVYYPDRTDREGKNRPVDYDAWQKDTALSVNFILSNHWNFKLEYHYVDGVGHLQERDNPESMEKNWSIIAAKTSLNF